MHVAAEPYVVGQIPTDVVRVVVDHNLIGVPEPVGGIVEVVGGDAEIESREPEALRASALDAPDVRLAKSAGEVSVFPRTIDVVVRIVTAGVMSDPLAVGVDVRDIGMARLVGESAAARSRLLWPGLLLSLGTGCGTLLGPRRLGGGRAMGRNLAAYFAVALSAAVLLAASLREGRHEHK